MVKATVNDIEDFLTKVREIIKTKNGFHLVNRKKNIKALTKYNIPINSVKYFIEYLNVQHYSKGPEPDEQDQYDHDWWFFGRKLDDKMFYVKIRIRTKGRKQVVCLSFHPAKYPIEFPYK
ncbi:MAG: type II toxin-antitoxin system MqsR family toxin [Halanaerobiales bacterium]|nr:type II toxin-antitoxin system MqsR family toxin [Halanaerobiales bacterium]